MNDECEVTISSIVNPTEDEEKVKKAILNLFPNSKIISKNNTLEIHDSRKILNHFKSKLKEQKIRATVRTILETNEKLKLNLNKQTAYINIINITEGNSILGDITLNIKTENKDDFIEWLTPSECLKED